MQGSVTLILHSFLLAGQRSVYGSRCASSWRPRCRRTRWRRSGRRHSSCTRRASSPRARVAVADVVRVGRPRCRSDGTGTEATTAPRRGGEGNKRTGEGKNIVYIETSWKGSVGMIVTFPSIFLCFDLFFASYLCRRAFSPSQGKKISP